MVSPSGSPLGCPQVLDTMGALLRHRGPDAHGVVQCIHGSIGAERLRVIDPSTAGDQPFIDPAEQVWLVLNGAIYNAQEIRRRYRDYPFRSASDAESLMPLYLDRGCTGFADVDGMFALAIYDLRTRKLLLARDRSGEKPLFYSHVGDEIWFASEMQALLKPVKQQRELDHYALRDFITFGYVREPRTMFADISKVESGTAMQFCRDGVQTQRYWNPDVIETQVNSPHDAVQQLDHLIREAVAKQLTADVPIGVLTSGGVDSSLLAAVAAHTAGADKICTLSVGFDDRPFDESVYARQLSTLLGTRHVEISASDEMLLDALRTVTTEMAEPISDPAVLPTLLLANEAKKHVTVVLSGEGADELFGGYPTYLGHLMAPHYQHLPKLMRTTIDQFAAWIPPSPQRKVSTSHLFKRFVSAARLPLAERHIQWFGSRLHPRELLIDNSELEVWTNDFPSTGDPLRRAMLFDYRTYLRDDLLPKVDRATMLRSVEARSPYLDEAVIRFALALQPSLKVRSMTTKWLLKQVARKWLPRSIVNRRKRGLSVPVSQWINSGLREEVDRLLDRERIADRGLLDAGLIHQLLSQHRRGSADHGRALWTIIILEYWFQHWFAEA